MALNREEADIRTELDRLTEYWTGRTSQFHHRSVVAKCTKLVMKIFDEYTNILKGMYSIRFNGRSDHGVTSVHPANGISDHGDTPSCPSWGTTPPLINSLTVWQPNKVRKHKERKKKGEEELIFVLCLEFYWHSVKRFVLIRDEVNRREFWVCDRWVCDLEGIGTPSIFSITRSVIWTPEVARNWSVSRWACNNNRSSTNDTGPTVFDK